MNTNVTALELQFFKLVSGASDEVLATAVGPKTKSPVNQTDCFEFTWSKEATLFTVSSGVCPTPGGAGDSNTIKGAVTKTASAQVSTLALEFPQFIALLYQGSAPTPEDGEDSPISFSVVTEGGYQFLDVPSGDYYIVFKSLDGFEFDPPYISVTAIGGGETTAPAIAANEIQYADAGCTKQATLGSFTGLATRVQRLSALLQRQANFHDRWISRAKLRIATRARLIGSVARARSASTNAVRAIAESVAQFPAQLRSACPAENACTVTSLASRISAIDSALRQLESASLRLERATNRVLPVGKVRDNTYFGKRAKRHLQSALKATAKLPKETAVCPEL